CWPGAPWRRGLRGVGGWSSRVPPPPPLPRPVLTIPVVGRCADFPLDHRQRSLRCPCPDRGLCLGGQIMDEAKLHQFMGQMVSDMGGAAMLANIILGDELGLYRAMADSQPITPDALANKTGCNARLVREWLSAHAASGYMEHRGDSFVLPEEQALALAIEDSPVYMAGGASVVAALFHDKDKLVSAMRGDGALA